MDKSELPTGIFLKFIETRRMGPPRRMEPQDRVSKWTFNDNQQSLYDE